jgi:hypothetical protein
VVPARIVSRVTEICAFGSRQPGSRGASSAVGWMKEQLAGAGLADTVVTIVELAAPAPRQEWIGASLGRKEGHRRVVMSARVSNDSDSPGAHETAAGACALLESARVLKATQSKDQIGALPFDLLFELDRPGSAKPASPALAEIRFGELGLGARRDCLFVTLSGSPAGVAEMTARVARILAGWKGEKGFWKEFEVLKDPKIAPDGAPPLVTLSCTASADLVRANGAPDSRPFDTCPVAGTSGDTPEKTVVLEPHNAVNATRFALFLVAQLAAEQRPK